MVRIESIKWLLSRFIRFIPQLRSEPKAETKPLPSPMVELLTASQLEAICPRLKGKSSEVLSILLGAFEEVEINTPKRVACFLAQIAVESVELTAWVENLNYSAQGLMKTWPKRFPTIEIANQFARQPEKIANSVYANRMGNGDPTSGDGWRYRGRGPMQLTGKDRYEQFGKIMGIDLIGNPDLLLDKKAGILSATLYWKDRGLNAWVDKDDFKKVTFLINGGYNGLEHRKKYWETAKRVLGVADC